MNIDFVNEWPDDVRAALTTGQVGRVVRINHVTYYIADYDTVDDTYVARAYSQLGQPGASDATYRITFADVQDFVAY